MLTIAARGQAGAGRPSGRTSVAAGVLGLVVTLVVFTVVFVGFLIAPLLVLGIAFLAYLALRPRKRRAPPPGEADSGGLVTRSSSGFGAGAP